MYSKLKSDAKSKHLDVSSSFSAFLNLLEDEVSFCRQRPLIAYDSATIFKLRLQDGCYKIITYNQKETTYRGSFFSDKFCKSAIL